jgi:hypothetical protein
MKRVELLGEPNGTGSGQPGGIVAAEAILSGNPTILRAEVSRMSLKPRKRILEFCFRVGAGWKRS